MHSAKYVSIATLQSSNGMKTFFYSNYDDDFFQHRWNFRLNTICRSLRNDDWFTGPKTVVHNFLRIPQYTFPLLQSTVEMESSRSSAQTMTTTSSNIVETFASNPFVEASEMTIDFLVEKAVVHIFCGFRKVRFHCYTLEFKWNQAVLLLKQWRRLLSTSLKFSFKYQL